MRRKLWSGMASHYCRASDSIRLSGEKIIRAIHTHKGSVCLFWCVCVCVCILRQRQKGETYHLRGPCKAFTGCRAFELGFWCYSELKWLVWFWSNDTALSVFVHVCVCVPKHMEKRRKESRERQVRLCCCATVSKSIYDHNTDRRTQSGAKGWRYGFIAYSIYRCYIEKYIKLPLITGKSAFSFF